VFFILVFGIFSSFFISPTGSFLKETLSKYHVDTDNSSEKHFQNNGTTTTPQ